MRSRCLTASLELMEALLKLLTWRCASPLQVSIAMGEPDANMDALMNKMERLQTQIDAVDGFDLDRQLERAMDALRCPPGQLGVRQRCKMGA